MAFEETKEEQQMYSYFMSCIYIIMILEIIMNFPVTANDRVTGFVLELIGRFGIFNSVWSCKVAEWVCIGIVAIGTAAKKSMKFNVRTTIIYPLVAGAVFTFCCLIIYVRHR